MFEIFFNPKLGLWVEDQEAKDRLQVNYLGELKKSKLFLEVEEALFLMKFQGAVCKMDDKELGFNELAAHFIAKEPRLFIKYNAYRDWRDRGLILKRFETVKGRSEKTYKKYPFKPLTPKKIDVTALWYPDSLFSVFDAPDVGKELFAQHWFGQFGIYKQLRGRLLKLNWLETVFLSKHFGMKVVDAAGKKLSPASILKKAAEMREYARQLYEVYEDWRLRGFIVKTGFKFGSHFRIYFPGVSPLGKEGYVHSRHVLHVFPKDQKLLVSEWARVVRVAHSVKKTFLLGIPELAQKDYIERPVDFVAWRRKKGEGGLIRETPEDKARYMLVAFSEDEHIGGIELGSLLEKAKSLGLELLLSITDSETSITYYVLKRIILPGSNYEYYEIEWMKP